MSRSVSAIDVWNSHGDSPLHVAARLGMPHHVKALLDAGADPQRPNASGCSALALATDVECRRLLRQRSQRGEPRSEQVSVAIFGNSNNYPLLLAEGLRHLGHRVSLGVTRATILSRPESKYPLWKENYPDWVHDLQGLTEDIDDGDFHSAVERLAHFVGDADLAILNDLGPAFSGRLRVPTVAFLTGSDLTYFADYRTIGLRTSNWDVSFMQSPEGQRQIGAITRLITEQRIGIRRATLVSFAHRDLIPQSDMLLDQLDVPDSNRIFLFMADTFRASSPASARGPLRIFNGARIDWIKSRDGRFDTQDLKGTDILLKGFAGYVRRGGSGTLHLIAKGHHVAEAKQLAAELRIDDRIVWADKELTLSDYAAAVDSSDVVCDQLAQSFPGMVTLDALAMGRPVLANLRNEVFGRHLDKPLPGLQAATPQEVESQLLKVDRDREGLRALGLESRTFAENFLSPEVVAYRLLRHLGLHTGDQSAEARSCST